MYQAVDFSDNSCNPLQTTLFEWELHSEFSSPGLGLHSALPEIAMPWVQWASGRSGAWSRLHAAGIYGDFDGHITGTGQTQETGQAYAAA